MNDALYFIFRLEYIIQLLTAEVLVAWNFRRRSHFALRLTGVCLLSCAVYLGLQSIQLAPVLPALAGILAGVRYFAVFLCTVLGLMLSYRESFWSILFCCSAAQAAQHFAHRLRDLILVLTGSQMPLPAFLALSFLLFAGVYAGLYVLFLRKMRSRAFPNINNRRMTFTVAACVILCLFIGVYNADGTQESAVAYDLAMMLVCFFILCYQFSFLDESYQKMEYEALQRTLQESKKQYEMTREKIELINIKCHDIRKQIRVLGREAHVDEAALKEITDAVNIYDAAYDTGNQVLNVILTDRSIYCDQNRIRFGCMIDGENLSFIGSMDLISLFANLIDNAIEAVKKLDNPEKAIISLFVRTQGGMVMIHCENYFRPGVEMENGLPVTSKEDRDWHGYGLKSIRFVAEKYGGAMSVSMEEDVFSVNVSIPIPEKN